jgi:hypothetical protein
VLEEVPPLRLCRPQEEGRQEDQRRAEVRILCATYAARITFSLPHPDSNSIQNNKTHTYTSNSAGGGGNSEARKTKISAKNEKLHDERARDRVKKTELEMKQSERKQKKEAKSGKKGGDDAEAGEDAAAADEPDEAATFGMNPARLAMMQGPERPQHRSRY